MKQRVLTAVFLVAVVLAALFSTLPWPILLLAGVFYLLGLREVSRMLGGSRLVYVGALVWPVVFSLSFLGTLPIKGYADIALGAAMIFGLGILSTWFAVRRSQRESAFALVASGWIAGPLAALIRLHQLDVDTSSMWRFATPVLLAMVPLWAGDSAAIFAGKAFGKHKLWPALSPKKTWEGAAANFIACVATAIPLGMWIGYSWIVGMLCGIAAGILGQYGDLFESWVKRQAGLKDSGSLLPGHGGILDRIDSLLFTAPAVALILWLWPGH